MYSTQNNRFTIKDIILDFSLIIFIASALFLNILSGRSAGLSFLAVSVVFFFVMLVSTRWIIGVNKPIKAYGIFTLACFFSFIHATDGEFSIDVLIRVLSTLISIISVYNYCSTPSRIKKFIFIFLLVAAVLSVINLLNHEFGVRDMFFGGVNPIATIMFVSIVFTFLKVFQKDYKFALLLPLFLYVLLLTASQKSILSLIILFITYLLLQLYFRNIKVFFKSFILFVVIGIIPASLFFKSELLEYSLIRTTGTIETVLTGKKVEGAAGGSDGTGLRAILREKGFEYFKDRPIFGYGINNFRPLYGRETGLFTYSHNTPIELLVGLGFFGPFLYYSLFFFLFVRLFKTYKHSKDSIFLFYIASLIAIINVGQHQQMYFEVNAHMFIALILGHLALYEKGINLVK